MPAININSVTIDRFYKYSTYQESIIQGTLVLGLIIIGIVVILCVLVLYHLTMQKINTVFLTSTLAFVGLSILNYISDRKANMLEPFIIYAIEAKKKRIILVIIINSILLVILNLKLLENFSKTI